MNLVNQRYACTCGSLGSFELSIGMQADAGKATGGLLDVMLLHEFENLICSLEDIVQLPLDWQRSSRHEGSSANDMLELKMEFDASVFVECASLYLPASALMLIGEHQIEKPQGVTGMSWTRLPCTLCISELWLSQEEQDNLHDGALLMIPESFHSTWNSSLQIGNSMQLTGKYSLAEDTWRKEKVSDVESSQTDTGRFDSYADHLAESAVVEHQGTHRVEISCRLDPADLMQADKSPVTIGLSTGQPGVVLQLQGEKRVGFYGALMPVGLGQAILLEKNDTVARFA